MADDPPDGSKGEIPPTHETPCAPLFIGYRFRRWAGRHRAALATSGAFVLLLAVAIGTYIRGIRAEQAKTLEALAQTELARQDAVAARDQARQRSQLALDALNDMVTKDSLGFYQKSLAIRERLAAADPKNADAQRDLLVAYAKLALVARMTHDFNKAAQCCENGLDVAHRFDKPEFCTQEVALLKIDRAFCQSVVQVLADVSAAKKLPVELQGTILEKALAVLLEKHDLPKVRQAAELLAELAKQPDDSYNAACGFARLSAGGDKQARQKDALRAIELLRQAIAKGFKNIAQMKQDEDLDSLRERDDFKRLLAGLEKDRQPKQGNK